MSRSFRKTPIFPFTSSDTEKWDKQMWHSLMRSKEKQRLHRITDEEMESFIPLDENDVSNPYWFNKDGKYYSDKLSARLLKRMRK